MLNSCKLDLAKRLKAEVLNKFGNSKIELETLIHEVVDSLGLNDPSEQQSLFNEILSWVTEDIHAIPKTTKENIIRFFEDKEGNINKRLYINTKRLVRSKIIDAIFNSDLSLDDSSISDMLKWYSEDLYDLQYEGNIGSSIQHYLDIQNNINNANADDIANYLIANHLPMVISVWFDDVISYDPDTNTYEFLQSHDISRDWTQEKMPELNNILKLMLEATPLIDGNFNEINVRLKQKDFIDSAIKIIQSMNHEDYQKFVKDPYYIIEYLTELFGPNMVPSTVDNFSSNMMRSFVHQWIKNLSNNEDHPLYTKSFDNTGFSHNPIDIFVRAFSKYNSKEYIDFYLEHENSRFSNEVGINSTEYGRFCDFVESIEHLLYPEVFDEKWNIKPNADFSRLSKDVFGNYYDPKTRTKFKDLVKLISAFKKKSADDFAEYIKSIEGASSLLIGEINIANRFNPYAISGSVTNAADKSLPVTGLNSVANNIEEESMRAQMRVEEEQQIYTNHGMVAPETPIKHTFFTTHRKSSKENIFIKTIFRSSIAADINGEKVIKDVGDMSIPESFMLSFIEDFYKEWFGNGQTIRIQAITPSDKALIPFFEFNIANIKTRYGKTNTEIEAKVLKEYENMYGQMLLNTVLDFAQVLSEANDFTQQEAAKKLLESITSADYTNIGIDKLKQLVTDLNAILKASSLSPDTINLYTTRFNTKYKTNKIIANIHDYQYNKDIMQISPYLLGAMEMFTSHNGLDHLYARFLSEINQEIGDFIVGSETISAKSLLNDDGSLKSNAKKSPLFTYFMLKNILSENILMNTVGTPASHKHSGDFNKMDSSAHLTMVKRMVALTATMHAGMENVLSGLPKNIKTMTIANDTLEMFTYSGNSTSGDSFLADLECWDGAMFSTGVTSMLIKQSITDVKPSGMDQKLLCHSFDPFKGAAVLLKMANYTIDNAFLRSFYFPGFSETQRNNPMLFMQTSFDQARINPEISINEDGHLIDYDGSEIYIMNYFLRDGEIIEIEDFVYNVNAGKFNIIYKTADGKIEPPLEVENNLFAIWQAFGGQFSCDKDGNYNEDSQRFLFTLINQLGEKKTDGNVRTQNDVDQYLKQQIVYYFPTSSASKSLKTPTTNLHEATNDVEKRYTYDVDINHFGFQLDPDHEAEDGTVREISQLMSFIAEKMYVPEHTKRIYQNLKRLLDLLNAHTFIDVNAISDYQLREQYRRKVNDVFEQKLIRIFSDPNTDAMGIVNQIAKELLKIQTDLHIPYSDGQMIGKMHTSVGVEFNKYIARQWSGRADVIVPSHNLAMIYEDEEGNTYMANDKKYLPDGETISIGQYLSNLVWVEDGVMDQAYYEANVIDAYEVMPTDVYYHYIPNIDPTIRGTWEAITIEGWNQLNAVRDDILNGGIYVKAIDRPRNLRSKQVYIDITTSNGNSRRIGMYHFATMQKISNLGIALDGKTLTKEQKDIILKEKKELQHYFENIVLPAIAENNINVLQEELVNILDYSIPESPELLISFEYVVREEERLTTNNYSRVFGIKNMNFSEISQKKEMYFYEHLKKRYSELDVKDLDLTKASTILFSSDGTPTIITDIETIKNSQYYVEAYPIIDEDGYRVDNHGEQMYKWPENVRLYKYKFGSLEVEAIVLPELTNGVNPLLEEILDTGNFIFYKGNPINGKNLYDLNSSNIDDIFMRIARKQYKSWLKSNESIIARIPSQSLTFAMSIKTVGYLPYGNNLTMVSSTRNYLSGEDFKYIGVIKSR